MVKMMKMAFFREKVFKIVNWLLIYFIGAIIKCKSAHLC